MPSQNVSTLAGLRAMRDLQGHENHIGSPLIEAGAGRTIGSVLQIISRWVDRSNQRDALWIWTITCCETSEYRTASRIANQEGLSKRSTSSFGDERDEPHVPLVIG